MINNNKYTKFEAIKKRVKKEIASGRYKLEERLPSEKKLAELYGVNRLTVNRAMTELVQEQWLYRVNGKGTFVSNMYHSRLQENEFCHVHFAVVSLRRSIDISFAHHALNFFRGQENFDCKVHETNNDPQVEYTLLQELLQEQKSYIFLIGFCNPKTRKLIRDNAARFVILGSAPELEGAVIQVSSDFEAGGRSLMDYFFENGHQRIAYCGDTSTGDMPGRYHAWRHSLTERQLDAPDEYVISFDDYDIADTSAKIKMVEAALKHYLQLPKPPTAIFCSNDDLAITMIHLCYQQNIRIPEQLSICGFDGSVIGIVDSLSLTTVRQPYEEILKTSIELLQNQMVKNYPHVILNPEFFPGKTVHNLIL